MNAIQIFSAQPWVAQLGWALVHFLWEGAAIAALYAIARRWATRSRSAQARYLLACAAMTAMLAAPIVTFSLSGGSEAAPNNPYVGTVPISSTVAGAAYAAPAALSGFAARAWQDDVMPWIVMVWLMGTILLWLRLAGGYVIAARMRSMFVRPAPAEWQQKVDEIRERIRLSRSVRLLTSALVQVPTVVGWLRPVVLMPIGALAGLAPEHVEALLAHELAHIRRHDYLVNILQSIAEALLFYHPAVWWISNHIRNEREHCCDDIAVNFSGDAVSYARALADLETYRPAHFTPVLAATGGSLRERIGRLLGQPAGSWRPTAGPGTVVAAILIVSTSYGLFGQPARPSFEAVSIKPNNLGGGEVHEHDSPGRLNARMTTSHLIQQAFALKDFQLLGGPAWLRNNNYDFVATTGAPIKLSGKVLEPYLQSLLAARFQLKYHRETKELPVYSLVTAKSGPKLKTHTGGGGENMDENGGKDRESMTATKLSMAGLADFLARQLNLPVIDNTGIDGEFDLKLDWSPDQISASSGPSIFTAVQEQLGLRLESTKGPVEILVVDSIEKPSEN